MGLPWSTLVSKSVTGWVPTGIAPDGIAFTPDGRWAFVSNGASNDVAVIDLVEGAVTARLPAGDGPSGVLFLP